jgi:hypothetical protein
VLHERESEREDKTQIALLHYIDHIEYTSLALGLLETDPALLLHPSGQELKFAFTYRQQHPTLDEDG